MRYTSITAAFLSALSSSRKSNSSNSNNDITASCLDHLQQQRRGVATIGRGYCRINNNRIDLASKKSTLKELEMELQERETAVLSSLYKSKDVMSLYTIISSCLQQQQQQQTSTTNSNDDAAARLLEDATIPLLTLTQTVRDAMGQQQQQYDDNLLLGVSCSQNKWNEKCPNTFKLAKSSVLAANALRQLMRYYGPGRGKARHSLLAIVESSFSFGQLSTTTTTDHHDSAQSLATISIIAALSLSTNTSTEDQSQDDDHLKVSRASASGLLPKGRYQNPRRVTMENNSSNNNDSSIAAVFDDTPKKSEGNAFGIGAMIALLEIAATATALDNDDSPITVDLHIVSSLARSFPLARSTALDTACGTVICQFLEISSSRNNGNDDGNDDSNNYNRASTTIIDRKIATTAFGLAAEIGPWTAMSCIPLIDLSNEMQLWHAAERICVSYLQSSESCSRDKANMAVQTLLDGAFEERMYRRADAIATEFYEFGGRARYVEARFMHACTTISKAVQKRQCRLLDRQVERVDKAIAKVQNDNDDVAFINNDDDDDLSEAKRKVREFALTRLREANQHEQAHRLATLWNMEYWYDSEEAEKYVQARRDKYLQWEEAFKPLQPEENNNAGSISIPDVLSNPTDLLHAFATLESTINPKMPVIGFDVEWGDDDEESPKKNDAKKGGGAALLQLSTARMAILIDIPALGRSRDGCEALANTVGCIFRGNTARQQNKVKLLGFSCRQDLSRLGNSPCASSSLGGNNNQHWFPQGRTSAVVDIKPLISIDNAQLRNLGLSRICDYYLGKPLDKSEQCSMWQERPLSQSQRVYAALDAWACVAIYEKLSFRSFLTNSGGSTRSM